MLVFLSLWFILFCAWSAFVLFTPTINNIFGRSDAYFAAFIGFIVSGGISIFITIAIDKLGWYVIPVILVGCFVVGVAELFHKIGTEGSLGFRRKDD